MGQLSSLMLPQGGKWKGGDMCMHFSVGSQKARNGRFRKVPAADDVGALETFPVYYAGERGGPKRRAGGSIL